MRRTLLADTVRAFPDWTISAEDGKWIADAVAPETDQEREAGVHRHLVASTGMELGCLLEAQMDLIYRHASMPHLPSP